MINADRTGEKSLTQLFDVHPPGPLMVMKLPSVAQKTTVHCKSILWTAVGATQDLSAEITSTIGIRPWSPDGRRIAFVHARALGQPAVYSMNANGEDRVRLSDCHADSRPAWAPDGTQIVYNHALKQGIRNLFVVDIETFLAAKEAPPTQVIPEPEPEQEPEQEPEPEPEPEIEQSQNRRKTRIKHQMRRKRRRRRAIHLKHRVPIHQQ